MASNFKRDLKNAKVGESTVRNVLANSTWDWDFKDVSDDASCYYKGDIEAYNVDAGYVFLDVKMDSRIADTGNVLCEEKVYSYVSNQYYKGNMDSDYDVLAIISVDIRKIWLIDFKVLKAHYKEGRAYNKVHCDDYGYAAQKTIGTLCSLDKIEKWGGLLYIIDYDSRYLPTRIKKIA